MFVEKNLGRQIDPWPPAAWDFDSLAFAAFYYHPSLYLARAQLAVAQGGEVTAGQRPNPVLTVTPGYNTTTAVPSPWIPLGFLDIPLETAGKRGHRRTEAAHLSNASRLNVATVAWQVRSDLRSSLIELRAANQRETLLKTQIGLQEEVIKLLEQQRAAGAVAGAEIVPFRIALTKARLDLTDAQRLAVEARARVAEAIGLPLHALDPVRFSFDWLTQPGAGANLVTDEIRRSALQSRPDILGALAEYAASEAALHLEIAKQYPDIHLQPGYQYDQGDNKWTLGLVVDLPILNQNQGPIAVANARREEAAARFNALQAKVLAEIDRSVQVLQISEKNSATLRLLAEEQARRRDAIAAQLKAGAADQLDVVNAQVEYATTELVQLEGQTRLQQALGALEDAVRRPIFGSTVAAPAPDSDWLRSAPAAPK
jgi:outer membrane protein TolC